MEIPKKISINVAGIFGSWIFFVLTSIMGTQYVGSEDSNLFTFYWVIIFIMSVIAYIKTLKNNHISLKYNIMPLMLPVFIIQIFLFSFLIFGINSNSNLKYFLQFVCQSVATFLLGMKCAINREEEKLFFSIEVIVLISIPVLISSFNNLINERQSLAILDNVGGMGRMGIAYSSVKMMIFMMLAYFLPRDKKEMISYPFNTILYDRIRLLYILFLTMVIIATGTRGALISIILIPIAIAIYWKKSYKGIGSIRPLIYTIILVLFLSLIILNFEFSFIEFALYRIRLFLSGFFGDDTWAGGSGREDIYMLAFNEFQDRPITGMGPLGFIIKYNTYAHNLFLDILADYGLVGFLILLTIMYKILKKFICIARNCEKARILMFLFSTELLRLMVSGNIYTSPILWFFLGYCLSYNPDKRLIDTIKTTKV